jgi:UDP-N-acetylglucosamine 4,6-dehydratase
MSVLDYIKDRVVLITGAAGTVGTALADVLLPHVRALRCFDHSENDLFFLHRNLAHKGKLSPQLGDIRDLDRLRFALTGVDVVYHAAALKHVVLGEYNPFEVVQSNLNGLDNVIRASLDCNVERVIFTSTDKAVNPTNVMGASKMMGERLIGAAHEIRGTKRTRFASVRFGNVIGSRGSVVPIFMQQLQRGEPLTITDERMTRYIMTVEEAANLVIEAGARMAGGEIFVTKMRAVNITDLALALAEVAGKPETKLSMVGSRSGEKLYEELIAPYEMARTLDLERLLVVLPAGEGLLPDPATKSSYPDSKPNDKDWNSSHDQLMTRAEITAYLRDRRVVERYLAEV